MIDLGLDPITGDLALDESGDVSLIDGADTVRQRLKVRLTTQKGQWWLDPEFGTPYFSQIITKKITNLPAVNAVFVEAILSTPGVEKLLAPIDYQFDPRIRVLSLSFSVLADGSTVDVIV